MSIQELVKLLLPPEKPLEIPKSADDWEKFEKELGTTLPNDYKAIIDTYGTGVYGKYLWLHNPFSNNKNLEFTRNQEFFTSHLKELRAEFEDFKHVLLFPEKDGLLSCGGTDDGDTIFWKTKGKPSEWHMVLWAARSTFFETFSISLSEFLVYIMKGSIKSEIITEDVFFRKARFFSLDEDYLSDRETMAIYHDAYLFSPDEFATFIREHAAIKVDTWDKFIEQALIFAEDNFVLQLLDIYGG